MTSLLKYYSIKGGQRNQAVENPGRLNKCSVFQEIAYCTWKAAFPLCGYCLNTSLLKVDYRPIWRPPIHWQLYFKLCRLTWKTDSWVIDSFRYSRSWNRFWCHWTNRIYYWEFHDFGASRPSSTILDTLCGLLLFEFICFQDPLKYR